MIDSEYLQRGKTYSEMPDVHIIYISLTDLWNAGKTTYRVKKVFDGTDVVYDDGMHILYVNAAVNDGSDTARLMEYFKTTDPEDMSQGELSKRVHFLKREEGGYTEMCEAAEKWYKEGETVGERNGEMKKAKETANELQKWVCPLTKLPKRSKSTKRPSGNGWVRDRPRHKIIPRGTRCKGVSANQKSHRPTNLVYSVKKAARLGGKSVEI